MRALACASLALIVIASTPFAVANQPPSARFSATVHELTVTVNASASADPDYGDSIVRYEWEWGDGTANGGGVNTTHTYASVGTYPIILRVTDQDGALGSTVQGVTTTPVDVPPTPVFTAHARYLHVDFDASNSTDERSVVAWAWDFGDATTGSGVQASHDYPRAGLFKVTLTVTDDAGHNASLKRSVAVVPKLPLANFTVEVAGLNVTVDASASQTKPGKTLSYRWDFGDGDIATGVRASHHFGTSGEVTILLTVTDSDRATDNLTQKAKVGFTDQAPAETAGPLPQKQRTPGAGALVATMAIAASALVARRRLG